MPKVLKYVIAWLLIVPGFLLFITPLPVGIFMMTAGFLLLHSASPRFRRNVVHWVSRFPGIAARFKFISKDERFQSADSAEEAEAPKEE